MIMREERDLASDKSEYPGLKKNNIGYITIQKQPKKLSVTRVDNWTGIKPLIAAYLK